MKNRWNIKWVKTFPVVADCEESNVSIFLGKKNRKLCSHKYSSGAKCSYQRNVYHLFLKDFMNKKGCPSKQNILVLLLRKELFTCVVLL